MAETMEFFARAQLVKLEIDRLGAEARTCRDLERLEAITREMDVLHASMLDIRRDQILSTMPKPKGRPWWKFWGASPSTQPKENPDA